MPQLKRRGFILGDVPQKQMQIKDRKLWHEGYPVLLQAQCLESLNLYAADIKQTEKLAAAILEGEECDEILAKAPYVQRIEPKFQSLGSVFDERDQRDIEMVAFDAMSGDEIIAEDLWLKISWLSLYEEDDSLRFRFSFGVDLEEDVAADPERQKFSAELTDAIFPESAIITKNLELEQELKEILASKKINFVERIIYFNAPNGGAYFHHDLERGHDGVVFAQLTGSTFWFALPKQALIDEIIKFADAHPWPNSLGKEMQNEMNDLVKTPKKLGLELDSFANNSLIHFINETKEFAQHLMNNGHGTKLNAGDMLLLPQKSEENCCWHSVFGLGEEIGEALSFAIRAA